MMRVEDKDINCLVCSAKIFNHLFVVNGYSFMECCLCGFIFIGNELSWNEKKGLNENRYGEQAFLEKSKYLDRENKFVLDKIESMISNKGNLLEIGCGTGQLLFSAMKRGWDVRGIELSHGAAKTAADHIGPNNIYNGTIRDYTSAHDTFDVIVMKSVIEHIRDPRDDLKRIYSLLKNEGIFYMLTPNIESFESRLYGPKWFALTPGDHLCFFSPTTLKQLLTQIGFKTTWLVTTESYEDVISGIVYALKISLRRFTNNESKKSIPSTIGSDLTPGTRHFLKNVLEWSRFINFPWFLFYSKILEKFHRGSCIRCIAYKG